MQGAEIELCQDSELEFCARDGGNLVGVCAILDVCGCVLDIEVHDTLGAWINDWMEGHTFIDESINSPAFRQSRFLCCESK